MTLNSARGAAFQRARPIDDDSLGWVRPFDWLVFPVRSDPQVIQLLYAITRGPNYFAIQCQGAITIDWGDGSSPENFASNTLVNKKLDYDGYTERLLDGAKQGIITITPQSGHDITSINMNVRHSEAVAATGDLLLAAKIKAPALASLNMRGDNQTRHNLLESIEVIGLNQVTSINDSFRGLVSLRDIGNMSFPILSSSSAAFAGCVSITEADVKSFDFDSVLTTSSMFSGCTGIKSLSDFTVPNATSVSGMFENCSSLRTINNVSFPNVSGSSGYRTTFQNCGSLDSVKNLNTPNVNADSTNDSYSMFRASNNIAELEIRSNISFRQLVNSYTRLAKLLLHDYNQWDINLTNSLLDGEALDDLFESLGVAVGKTITITGSFGVNECNPSIATNKGWTVVTT